ncbi:putative bifunctional diguanylate cyclase/phosphodiesterase [Pararhizobium antarcticum]|uniref:Diguanylate cyclase n=1 Tax=Pararhizobium antarcticum TaxID=1798805 RepID=A0A657M0P2_9HYPH|nr:EAL domain-containing protein [Pararhizobium antarcticum]OJF91035.1 diguanylate cyclase [Rhizobium sp. 58]OJF99965.1 diguanylate cyclase [Pararhizobium antarcticum]
MRHSQQPSSRLNQWSVALVAIVFILVTAVLAGLVARSIDIITTTSNAIDDDRARHAAGGALQSLRKQLAATVRDNAYWDDAYRQVNLDTRLDWLIDNWASTTADYPLYDTALVIDSTNKPVIAYRNGEAIQAPLSDFFGKAFDGMLAQARKSDYGTDVPVHFIRSDAGVALIGAAVITPSATDESARPENHYVLAFAKHVTPDVVAEISGSFNIAQLSLDPGPLQTKLSAPLQDVDGNTVAYINWPSQTPGTKSYREVESTINAAAVIFVIFLLSIGAVGLFTINSLKTSGMRSRHRASHDALTGLLNRSGLLETMAAIRKMHGSGNASLRLHFIDLDGFKGVNDAWGHGVGDELIVAVAGRLRDALSADAMIARLGGDEFAVVTVETSDAQAARSIGQQIQAALERVFEIGGRTIGIGASIGVALSRAGTIESDELIRRADIALYRAKDLGRGITVEFEESFDVDTRRLAKLEDALRKTLSNEGIDVAFQPLIQAGTGTMCGVEALARWTSGEGVRFGPDVFIPLAERSGLIDILGLQVLTKSLEAARQWPGIGLSVNVSPVQLKNPNFTQSVVDALKAADFDPQRLCIEVTEGLLISDPEQAQRAIEGLKAAGIKIALDDFGSGFASIGTLRRFGFDRMKVDRSLIVALDHDENAGAILQATIALANALQIPVTAEGIETEQQALAVKLSGCDELQGYLFSKPISAEALNALYFEGNTAKSERRA